MQDPLSGTKATADFITDLMTARVAESDEMEKAGAPDVESLSPDAQDVYRRCLDGFEQADVEGDNAQKVCALYARDFDQRHPNGISAGEEADDSPESEDEVEKTVSTAGMSADLGTPSSEVALTDVPRKRRLGQTA